MSMSNVLTFKFLDPPLSSTPSSVRNGRAPSKAGRTPLFVEEGLIGLFANRAADPDTGAGVFDITISVSAASARVVALTDVSVGARAGGPRGAPTRSGGGPPQIIPGPPRGPAKF
jgi:hypothetical protein